VEKDFDFAYVCGPASWNKFCRNSPLAKLCLAILAENGFSAAIFGRDKDAELPHTSALTLYPYLPWHEFLKVLARCRYLLVPNIYDASPRLLAEALRLNIPLLVNKQILGGWHYVERPSGIFFKDETDFESTLEKLLKRRFQAREYFERLFGPRYAEARLRRFLRKLGAVAALR